MDDAEDLITDHVNWFNCLGEVNLRDSKLGNGFLKNGAIKALFNSGECVCPSHVILFGRKYHGDTPLLEYQNILLRKCEKNYKSILDNAMTDTWMFGTQTSEIKSKNYSHLRKEICEFMNYVHIYLASQWDDNSFEICKQILLTFPNNLCSFWSLLKNLSDLPKSVIQSSNSIRNMSHQATFHLMHLKLDLLWNRLVIIYRIEQLMTYIDLQDILFDIYETMKLSIQALLEDLFAVSIIRFEKLSPHEVKRKSPFPCTCVKELWLLLQIFIDKKNEISQENEFWCYINNLCSQLMSLGKLERKDLLVNNLKCSNPVLFNLWILFHLGQLYSYSEKGEYVGSSCERMKSNYALLEKILKVLLSVNVVSEGQLRLCIPFITEMLTDLWPAQRDPVCKLWEHFHHRLNGCFFLPGANTDSIAISCGSGADILLQVVNIIDPKKNLSSRPENSYQLFLRLLENYIRKNPLQWPNIKGRIFSKFSQTKMQTLKEMGIFNFSFLFLTMAMAGHTKEVGDKMQDLLNQVSALPLDFNRRLIVWKAHLALLQMYIEKDMDIADASTFLMEDVHRMSNCKDPDSTALFNVLARGLRDIIMNSKSLNCSEHSLIGSWIISYMKLTPEPALLIDTLSETITKVLTLSRSVGMIEYNASESHLTKMYLAICKYVLPYIKEKFAVASTDDLNSKIADLAVNISLLALNRTNVGVAGTSVPHLFESFAVNANPLNAKLSVRYVCVLLQEEGILSELMDTFKNYEILIIQTWIRCSVYVFEDSSFEELHKLTLIVSQMPSFIALCQEASVDLQKQKRPVEAFIYILGLLYLNKNTLEKRSEFREKCLQYLTPLVKSFERMLRNKDVNEKMLYRMYEVAALIVLHCGSIIYSKSQPYCIFNSIVNSLLLPVAMFKPGAEIPATLLCAMLKTFPKFVRGIVKLNNAAGNSLLSTIKNLIVRYFPRLVGKSFMSSQGSGTTFTHSSHPLLLCFENPSDEVSKQVLEIISKSFVKVGDTQCMNALMFLLEVLQEKKFSEDMLKLFIDISLSYILEVIIMCDSRMTVVKRQAFHLLKEVLCNIINSNSSLREIFWTVMWTVIQRHIILHSVNIMSLLCKMCELAPDIMNDKLQMVKEMMTSPSVFHRANVAQTVRLGVENMEKLLSLSKQNSL